MANARFWLVVGGIGLVVVGNLVSSLSQRDGLDPASIEAIASALDERVAHQIEAGLATPQGVTTINDDLLSRQMAAFQQFDQAIPQAYDQFVLARANELWTEAALAQQHNGTPFEETILAKLAAITATAAEMDGGKVISVSADSRDKDIALATLTDLDALRQIVRYRAEGQPLPVADLRPSDFLPEAQTFLTRSQIASGRGFRFAEFKDSTITPSREVTTHDEGNAGE